MDLVDTKNIPAPPDIPYEDLEVPLLGGVRVRSLDFPQRLAFRARCASLGGKDGVQDGDVYATIPELLEMTVMDSAGRPVYSAARWRQYGTSFEEATLDLFNAAMRVSGLRSDEAKKN